MWWFATAVCIEGEQKGNREEHASYIKNGRTEDNRMTQTTTTRDMTCQTGTAEDQQ